jgi:iron-sulfur cluster assembly protein
MDSNSTHTDIDQKDFEIHLTDAAKGQICRIIASETDSEGSMLRLGVEGGGCSGLAYSMELTRATDKLDRIFDFGDFKIVVDARSLLYLGGTTIDYSDKLLGGGFKFTNPRARRSCGCGTSFSI